MSLLSHNTWQDSTGSRHRGDLQDGKGIIYIGDSSMHPDDYLQPASQRNDCDCYLGHLNVGQDLQTPDADSHVHPLREPSGHLVHQFGPSQHLLPVWSEELAYKPQFQPYDSLTGGQKPLKYRKVPPDSQEGLDSALSNQRLLDAGSANSQAISPNARLAALPTQKQKILETIKRLGNLYSTTLEHALDIMEYCTSAEQDHVSREIPPELTDRFLEPILKPLAAKGTGSRRGLESYRCLWPYCTSRVARKANAISHLLSHVQYKPYMCSDCSHHPRFRYKHDYTRHCKSHLSDVYAAPTRHISTGSYYSLRNG